MECIKSCINSSKIYFGLLFFEIFWVVLLWVWGDGLVVEVVEEVLVILFFLVVVGGLDLFLLIVLIFLLLEFSMLWEEVY